MRARLPASRRYQGCLGPEGQIGLLWAWPFCGPGAARSRQPVLLACHDRADCDLMTGGTKGRFVLGPAEVLWQDPASHPVCCPLRQVAVTVSSIRGRERRPADGCEVTPEVLGEQAGCRMPQPVRPGWVQDGTASAHRWGCVVRPIGVFAPEV